MPLIWAADVFADAYEVYDLGSDAMLTREEMYALLKPCLPAKPSDEDSEEGVKDLVDQTLKIHVSHTISSSQDTHKSHNV